MSRYPAPGEGRARRRYLAVPAGSYAPPTPPAALADPPEEPLFAVAPVFMPEPELPVARPATAPPVFLLTDVDEAAAELASSPEFTPGASPALSEPVSERLEGWTSSAFSTSEPGLEPERRRTARASRGTLGILAGAVVGAIIGVVLSTAMLALYAPVDFAGAIAKPVALWTNVEDWKVLAGALLIVVGFAVLGAGQSVQASAPRD